MHSNLRNHNQHPLVIIDAYGFAYRAYYSHPKLTNPEGKEVGAIYGFTAMLIRLLTRFAPQKVVAVFDVGKRNFRHELYADYKIHRPPTPEDLKDQLGQLSEVAEALNLKIVTKDGVEADDVIASIATRFQEEIPVVIFSSDKDLMQLVNERISIVNPVNEEHLQAQDVEKKFGVSPDRFVEYLALVGDASDNVPGVEGIGPKTAVELIGKFQNIEEIFANLNELKSRQKDLLLKGQHMAMLSMQLVRLKTDLNLELNSSELDWHLPDRSKVTQFFERHAFRSLFTRINSLYDMQSLYQTARGASSSTPSTETIIIESSAQLEDQLKESLKTGYLCIHAEKKPKLRLYFSSQSGVCFTLNGLSLSPACLKLIKEYTSNSAVKKIIFDFKALMHSLRLDSKEMRAVEDVMLMRYAVSTGSAKNNTIEDLIQGTLGARPDCSAKATHLLKTAYLKLQQELFQARLMSLYYDLDLPTAFSLYNMELEGIAVDLRQLGSISQRLTLKLNALEEEIFKLCGQEFNLASPKQLGQALYVGLGLPTNKRLSKSKAYSTDAEALEDLSRKGFPVADFILKWRALSKLKSTYTDALKEQADKHSGRIHTTFLQTSTSTGRLSSTNPNLQNIPIRTSEGKEVRSAFIAAEGYKIVSADYSQVELRILSHLAKVKKMQEAFEEGKDVHLITAQEVFGEASEEARRKAKAVNFGIVYGSTSFGIARQLRLNHAAAQQIIDSYFSKYPEIPLYMEETKTFARKYGYVLSIFGRRCSVEGINEKNYTLRSLAERAAINAPIQSTAADIIKLVALIIEKEILCHGCKLLLQVHDELVFECEDSLVEKFAAQVKRIMEDASPIKLKVNVNAGPNWHDISPVELP